MRRLTATLRRQVSVNVLEDRTVPALMVNEVFINPPGGTDNGREFVEIFSTTGVTSLSGIWMLEVEGDGVNAGTIDNAVNLSALSTGTNGMLLLGENFGTNGTTQFGGLVPAATTLGDLLRPGNTTIENGNATIMLVTNFTGTIGTDYDVDNDGTMDGPAPWTSVIDAAGWVDGGAPGKIYSPAALVQSSGTSDGITRFPSDASMSLAAWYSGDVIALGGSPDLGRTYDPIKCSANLPSGALLTPGDVNFAPTPPPSVTNVLIDDGTIQRSMIRTLKITFSEDVTFSGAITNAITVTRNSAPAGGNEQPNATGLVNLIATPGPGNVVTITFSKTGTNPIFGVGGINSVSLPDGRYTLSIDGSQITGSSSAKSMGGTYTLASDPAPGVPTNIFRFFGDVTGDGNVSSADFNGTGPSGTPANVVGFRSSFGGGSVYFDYDGDGSVAASDFIFFRLRFNGTVP